MRPDGRGTSARAAAVVIALALSAAACTHGGTGEARPSPSVRAPVRPAPVDTGDVAAWAAVWKDAFQQFADDVSAVVEAAAHRNFGALKAALARIPGDAREAVRKIDDAGAAPPGFEDEVARLRSLVDQASEASGRLAQDCLHDPGLPCAADVATLLSAAGQLMDALRPFGVDIDFHIDI